MIWITFTILLLLASIEAGLAYMREVLMQDELATSALLRGSEASIENGFMWITTAAQMGMGFVLPFALVFVAIPLETFKHRPADGGWPGLHRPAALAGPGAARAGERLASSRHAHRAAIRPAAVRAALARSEAAGQRAEPRHPAGGGPAGGDAMKRAVVSRVRRARGLHAIRARSPRNTGVYLLLDTSGTYRGELRKAQDVILYTLSKLEPADSFAVARIDTGSFSEKDIIAKTTFDERPSTANAQKRAFAQKVQNFVARENAAQYTDITGGLLQAVEFLNEKGTGRKTILIFSDLEQDLDKGYMRDIEVPFEGFDVVALNVVKLRQDNYDPRKYLARLEQWKGRVEKAGGRWRVVNDLDRLDGML